MAHAPIADYFFVAGLHDTDILVPTTTSNYYRHQELAANGKAERASSARKRGMSLPLCTSDEQESFINDMLHHVQTVMVNFDKERDFARDDMILPLDKRRSLHESSPNGAHGRTHRPRQYSLSFVPSTAKTARPEEDPFTTSQPHLLDIKYPPSILIRSPTQHDHIPFPAYLSMFCFPHDISLAYGDEPPPERTHSFAMTDDTGAAVYGTCCVFYEQVEEKYKHQVNDLLKTWVLENVPTSTTEYASHLLDKMTAETHKLRTLEALSASSATMENDEAIRTCKENLALYKELIEPVKRAVCDADHLWLPRCVGLLGRMPWINFYSDWLKILLDSVVGVRGKKNMQLSLDVPSAVQYLLKQVPLPPPGRFEIGLTINSRSLFISRPAMNEVPILKNFSLFPLFRALSPHLILAILETLLAEGKVVFLSQHLEMLSIAAEAFRYLLFPFYWPYVYIPVLPEKLLTCLQAPVPYIIGFQADIADIEDYRPEEACIVNLDSNTIHQSARVRMLPDRLRRKLQMALDTHCSLHTRCRVPYGVPLSVQSAFPNGRLLLTSHRSKVPMPYDSGSSSNSTTRHYMTRSAQHLPNGTATPNNSSTSSSLASQITATTTPMRPIRRNSNDSALSSDLSQSMMPQLPSFAKLSINPHALSSTSSFQSTVSVSPISPSRSQDRASLPGTPKSSHATLAEQDARQTHRMSEPPLKRDQESPADDRRFSDIMPKPRATFQESSPKVKHAFPLTADMNHTSLKHGSALRQGGTQDFSRRVTHVEGHIMTTLLPQELGAFIGYRCLCGQPVEKENPPKVYRLCQACHLVTHDACTEDILHPCLPASFDETKVQDSFLRMFASLLYGYRAGIRETQQPVKAGHDLLSIFSKEEFLKHSDKDTRDYLSHFVDSQLFHQFITHRLTKARNDPETVMFDEFIKLKLNRSKLKFVKAETPFLNDDSYRVSQVIWSTPAEANLKREYSRFPTNWASDE
ncbi:DENN-domain-containing protein [Hesseltinella vesiculosa]|uniref:DENN-domain-containing protein n=1 Tax=Hesseltinella vesiculosa TaxID=101127 RepID=A0A1X2GI73_9FUNG|nr:DENN-domain-containing protein [Hesseltinella vesiculosa]